MHHRLIAPAERLAAQSVKFEPQGTGEAHHPLFDGAPPLPHQPNSFDNAIDPPAEPLSPPPLRTRGLSFVPCRGLVLWCDFRGYRASEIGDKVRPVIVVSPWALNRQTACVVPVSQAASCATPLDIRLPANQYPFFTPGRDQWVKVQLMTHVEHARLGPMRVDGQRLAHAIAPSDLTRILTAVASIFALPGASEPEAARLNPTDAASSDDGLDTYIANPSKE